MDFNCLWPKKNGKILSTVNIDFDALKIVFLITVLHFLLQH